MGNTKGITYYTDNQLDNVPIGVAVRKQLEHSSNGLLIVSVSLKPIDFGQNIVLNLKRGVLTMFKQILAGLEISNASIVFMAEHDVLYSRSHFDFTPPRRNVFYYNENCWKVDAKTGRALFYFAKQTSGLCAYRSLLLEHYRKRVEMVERGGFSQRMGFEPGTHNRAERVDNYRAERWMSQHPNIDIRHRHNLTKSRWSKSEFRSQRYTKGWQESDSVPSWGTTKGRFEEMLNGLAPVQ